MCRRCRCCSNRNSPPWSIAIPPCSRKCAARDFWSASRPWCPSGDLVNALRDQKLLTVGAGDNVVRFLAPLIVSESEIEESVQRLERACVALSGEKLKKAAGVMSASLRHFLDISELPPKELRNMLAASLALKAKLKAHEINKPLEGKTLAMIFERAVDPHQGVVRRRHAPARRRSHHADGG